MKRLGIVFWGGMPLPDLVDCAKTAEEMGYDSVWAIEFWRDAFGPSFAFASATNHIKIGVGIANIHARSALTTALTANSLDEFSRGRCLLGVGTGPPEWAKDYHNAHWTGTYGNYGLKAMEEYVKILRQLMRGESANFSGKYFRAKDAKLGFDDPTSAPFRKNQPLYMAATGRDMTRLAGELGDGVIWNLMVGGGDYVSEVALRDLARGAQRAGKNPAHLDVAKYLIASVGEKSARTQQSVKYMVAFYATKYYNKPILEWHGFGVERAKMIEAFKAGDANGAASFVNPQMIEKLTACGTVDEVRNKLDEYFAAGVKLLILLLPYSGIDIKQAYQLTIKDLAP